MVQEWCFGGWWLNSGVSLAEIDAARQHVGYQHLRVRLDPPALMKGLLLLNLFELYFFQL